MEVKGVEYSGNKEQVSEGKHYVREGTVRIAFREMRRSLNM
jgi:hypothetical protein